MFDFDPSAVVDFVFDQLWAISILLLIISACSLAAAGQVANRRRSVSIAVALGDSTRSTLHWIQPPGAAGFVARFAPAPDPFAELVVAFVAAASFSPLNLAARIVRGRTQELRISGRLSATPAAEILWSKRHLPDRAVGRGPATGLWLQRRLDFIPGEYALHGANTNAIDHAFGEMQRRFGPFVTSISVLSDAPTHVVVNLEMAGFNSEEIPALVAALRSLGRAALIQ